MTVSSLFADGAKEERALVVQYLRACAQQYAAPPLVPPTSVRIASLKCALLLDVADAIEGEVHIPELADD